MALRREIIDKFAVLLAAPVLVLSLVQCANKEVKRELSLNVEKKGVSFARELAAQSPFKKVEMSWREASELMKKRNPRYLQAILDKEESQIKKGLVNNVTYEVRKSLTNSVQSTLDPGEIAKVMKNPVATFPKQLESITDLKNISHSLTQSEWGRISQSVRADAALRREMVKLHVLFCQSENLEKAERELEILIELLNPEGPTELNKTMSLELAEVQMVLKKERNRWLDEVRNFFNAEYYDVQFSGYERKLSFYREVIDPEFSDWKRWRTLENSHRLATELQKQHGDDRPVLPGIGHITQNLVVIDQRGSLSQHSTLNEGMAKEVRQMLKGWRNLKSVQQKIAYSEVSFPNIVILRPLGVADLKRVTILYQLKKREIEQLKTFWIIDEQCWDT